MVQKSYERAKDIRTDPFAIKRTMQETPEVITPTFKAREIDRAKLNSKMVIGQGQV